MKTNRIDQHFPKLAPGAMLRWCWRVCAIVAGVSLLTGCGSSSEETDIAGMAPPVAEQRPVELTIHGDTRIDNYYWIRDDTRSDPDVLSLLAAENAYTDSIMAQTASLQLELFTEMTGRLKVEDDTVPVRRGNYYYHREYRAGGEYPIYLRRLAEDSAQPEIMLDVNELSQGYDYYSVGNWSVSPEDNLLAYAEDTVSRREYTIRVKSLETGELLEDEIERVQSDIAWANDNRTFFYVVKDPQTLLPYQVWRHEVGTPRSADVLVYEETDPTFYTSVYKSRSDDFIVIAINSTDTSEIRLIDADRIEGPPKVFLPRQPGHEYRVRHVPGWFYVITNWDAHDFRLMRTRESNIGSRSGWEEVVAHRDGILLQDVEVFAGHIVVSERESGLTQLRVIDRRNGEERPIEFQDPAYTARLHSNPELDTTRLRFVYSSLKTPESVIEYDMATGASKLLKQDEVIGRFDAQDYVSERIYVMARDGVEVPVSLVYRPDRFKAGKNPLYITGYGAYGISSNPTFRTLRLSLLDRGFVYAIAHVRGGQDLGRHWYEDGKLFNKRNTFNDFIDVTKGLVADGYGAADKVFAGGGSAGGLLMGVIANEAPELYRGIIAHVPFVDVMTTMLDETIPLTTGEYSEWGDPRRPEDYAYMLGYSPYDQVRKQAYPNMLVTTGLWDSQVQYFEPVKWVQKLREHKTDDNLLLLHIDMETGHSGASARYERYRVDALEYAFILHLLDGKG